MEVGAADLVSSFRFNLSNVLTRPEHPATLSIPCDIIKMSKVYIAVPQKASYESTTPDRRLRRPRQALEAAQARGTTSLRRMTELAAYKQAAPSKLTATSCSWLALAVPLELHLRCMGWVSRGSTSTPLHHEGSSAFDRASRTVVSANACRRD